MTANASGALVLFSGGQDSTVCLAWTLDRYARVETVGFDYGQRHGVELQCRHVAPRHLQRALLVEAHAAHTFAPRGDQAAVAAGEAAHASVGQALV